MCSVWDNRLLFIVCIFVGLMHMWCFHCFYMEIFECNTGVPYLKDTMWTPVRFSWESLWAKCPVIRCCWGEKNPSVWDHVSAGVPLFSLVAPDYLQRVIERWCGLILKDVGLLTCRIRCHFIPVSALSPCQCLSAICCASGAAPTPLLLQDCNLWPHWQECDNKH